MVKVILVGVVVKVNLVKVVVVRVRVVVKVEVKVRCDNEHFMVKHNLKQHTHCKPKLVKHN